MASTPNTSDTWGWGLGGLIGGVEKERGDLEEALLHPRSSSPLHASTDTDIEWRGEIVISGVSLCYAVHLPDALRDISVIIPAGARVAILGKSGSGKSTLFRMLTGLNSYASGSASIDGHEIKLLGRKKLHRALAVIPQEPLLFSGPLRLSLDPRSEFSTASCWRSWSASRFGALRLFLPKMI